MTSLVALNRKKGSIKAQITRLETSVEDDKSSWTNVKITYRIKSIEKIASAIDALRSEYYSTVPEDDESNIQGIEDELLDMESRLEDLEVSFSELLNIDVVENKNSKIQENSINKNSLKLPEIPLPIFDGKYEEWNSFKSEFTNLITNNSQLSEIQKLHYLNASLKGSAKLLQTQQDSFQSLFNALEARYENKKILVNIHIKKIFEFEKISYESSKDLRCLVDTVNKNIRAMKNLGFERNDFSDILIATAILDKLDKESRKQFELLSDTNDVPKLNDLLNFLEKRSQTLENLKSSTIKSKSFNETKSKSFFVSASDKECLFCRSEHSILHCKKFLNTPFNERFAFVKRNKLCLRCISNKPTHFAKQCKSKLFCKVCRSPTHNSLLHKPETNEEKSQMPSNDAAVSVSKVINEETEIGEKQINLSTRHADIHKYVILPSAIVIVKARNNKYIEAKAIIDSCSQICCMSAKMANRLAFNKIPVDSAVIGLNDSEIALNYKIQTSIHNKDFSYNRQIELFVVPRIAELSPIKSLVFENLDIPKDINLADPNFYKSGEIDILLGAEYFFEVLKSGQYRSAYQNLLFTETVFGYVVSGVMKNQSSSQYCALLTKNENIDKTLRQFWEIENINSSDTILSNEERYCEEHFKKTYSRRPDGQYIVHMPMEDSSMLGESRNLALKRLNQIWQRLDRDSNLQRLYSEFMEEYKYLKHMEFVEEPDIASNCYYLPHHGVYRPEKISTPLRVVFNASSRTSSQVSLNDILLKGKIPQQELFSIMLRFRKHRYAFTADIQKMYRMVLIDETQRDFLRIVWKDNFDAPVKTFRLNTITYGTSSAPYLATRTLKQLALDEADNFPLGSSVVLTDFYIDDVLSGASSIENTKLLQTELIELLQRGKMKLHKWCANNPELLFSENEGNSEYSFDEGTETSAVKTLGVLWNPKVDCFLFKIKLPEINYYTKRDVLSLISKIFDPLGLIGPVVSKAKIFLQKLWLSKLDWNEGLSESMSEEWINFVSTLSKLEKLNIPRYIFYEDQVVLLGFADASSLAYGAAVYVQWSPVSCTSTARLLCSKSRVAPLKTLSVPRLELSACLLLSKLINKVLPALNVNIREVILYSDSTIALAWIKKPPYLLKTFVSNRVASIQELTSAYQWKHIASENNPADVLSRGLNASEILNCELWWKGPNLSDENLQLDPVIECSESRDYQIELNSLYDCNFFSLENPAFNDILSLSNNYLKLIRILAYIFRFVNNCRRSEKSKGQLTETEHHFAEVALLRLLQGKHFHSEISALKKASPVPAGSKLKLLNPFIDREGLIRVGGRLAHSSLEYDHKYPIVLPSGNKLVNLIFQHYHIRDFHVGPQALLNTVRQKYWPLGGRNIARKVVHDCVKCFKAKPITVSQLMGDLPLERVSPSSAFLNVGTDLCGPFEIKYKGQRKGTFQKIYVVIFVCMATKAVHLEFVTDLTSEALIATLKRFFARRGKSSIIFSDNATNFVGASAELKRLQSLVEKNEDISNLLTSEGITWKFVPPRAPNFGGLWEAGVKSFKYHLKRVVGSERLTLEEFLTVTIQIEGILNSRPLTPLSTDSDNFEVLTPGHFLVGKPLNAIPEPNFVDKQENRLNKWQRVQKFVQIIWKRWQNNYLSHLQQRNKWIFKKQNLLPGMLVLLKEEHLPICSWSLGRIIKVIPGNDGNVRVVEVRTPKGIFKRAISKICVLPILDNKENCK